jgi:DAHP synthase ferredoxin-like domain
MIIFMQEGSIEEQIRNVNDHLVAMGFGVHRSNSDSRCCWVRLVQ